MRGAWRDRFIERIVLRMAVGAASGRHHDLVRAMIHELEAIPDPAERSRFAMGAVVALLRLRLSERSGSPARSANHPLLADPLTLRGRSMPELSPSQVLRRHLTPFAVVLVALTTTMVANSSQAQFWAEEGSFIVRARFLLLSMPATLSLTIPMAVFVAVLWVFTRLGREGVLASQRETRSRRPLIRSVGLAAAAICALMLIANAELTPRANARFVELLNGGPVAPTDRSMTLLELREAVRSASAEGAPGQAQNLASYRVEIQKKFALAASCLFLALTAAVLGSRYHRWGFRMVFAATIMVFSMYYVTLIGGEVLAEQGRVSPFVGMWMGNWALLSVALLFGRRFGESGGLPPEGASAAT